MPRARKAIDLEVVESDQPPPQLQKPKRTRVMTPEMLEKLAAAREKAREVRLRKGELARKERELEKEIARKAEAEREARIERLQQIKDEGSKPKAKPAPAKPTKAPARRRAPPPPPESESEESASEYSEESEEEEYVPPPQPVRRRRAPAQRAPANHYNQPQEVSKDQYYTHQHPPAGSRVPEPASAPATGHTDLLRSYFPNL